ncbi:MAG TPA: SAM-dependent methyltransferase [Nocardioidaceae bacterium]|nr:SAM-dependent methyltransferase [Nocardioidaceae bacterium]
MKARDLPTWREAWSEALYGPEGFFRLERPADHFRTSVHASSLFAEAILELAGRTGLTAVTDIGAGGGELLVRLHELAPGRLDLVGIDVGPRPEGLPVEIAWRDDLRGEFDGLVLANEWLDNIPCDVVEVDRAGVPRYVHVHPGTGEEKLGEECHEHWLNRWWPLSEPGSRAEIGSARDRAWSDVLRRLRHGLAVAIDYGHTRDTRPPFGSLASYLRGRQVEVLPDGRRDITAHVAVDSLQGHRTTQREALHALGVDAARPAPAQAHDDPSGYVAGLSRASEAAELTARGGLGDFWWVSVPHGVDGVWDSR